MKRYPLAFYGTLGFLLLLIVMPLRTWAAPGFADVIYLLAEMYGLDTKELKALNKLNDLSHQTLQQLQAQQQLLTGSYGYGQLNYNPQLSSWGHGTDQWAALLTAYQSNSGEFGTLAKQLQQQFPLEATAMKPHARMNSYQTLQAQTALATRTASEHTYNQLQAKRDAQQQLHSQIDHTANIKAALDLQNRLSYENNLLQLELVRLLALSTEQAAINQQGAANRALVHQQFLKN